MNCTNSSSYPDPGSKPDHEMFVAAAYIAREKVALGEGRSKQEAEQDAAQKALIAKGW